MDGYAVQAADLAGASQDNPITLPVVGEIAAGRSEPIVVTPGTCVRIMTGRADAPRRGQRRTGGVDRRRHGERADRAAARARSVGAARR